MSPARECPTCSKRGAGPHDPDCPTAALAEVRHAAEDVRRGRTRYRASVAAAIRALEQAGARDAYAQIAAAAGVSRQAIRAVANKP